MSVPEEAKDTENIEILDASHTVISGTDTSACSSFLDNPDCYIAEEKCVEGPETRIINGVAVYKECWKKELCLCLRRNRRLQQLPNPRL